MADLPKERITPLSPFTNTGLDFAGPMQIKVSSKQSKVYIAVFVCFTTKAIHLELVSDLSAPACNATLRRFVARRGCPENIFSDNGSNFIGTRSELMKTAAILERKHGVDNLPSLAINLGAQWHTIPPMAPHCVGMWVV